MLKKSLFSVVILSGLISFAKEANKSAVEETYKVDTAASQIEWTGTKKVGDKHVGTVALKEGSLVFKGDKISGGSFVVDLNSINNSDLKDPSYKAKLEGHLKSSDFFDVTNHPEARFVIKSAQTKGKEWNIKGDLTVRGQTKPVEFPATIEMKDGKATGVATMSFDRTRFGIEYNSIKNPVKLAADKIIEDNITLKLNLVAKK